MSWKRHKGPMEWVVEQSLVAYPDAVARMEQRVADIRAGTADELIWLVEHPPLYTSGTSAKAQDLLQQRFPVYSAGRGGQYTYHGPGQRIAYVMLDLKKRAEARNDQPDIRRFVKQLEQWIIDTLATFDVVGEIREGRVGVWVNKKSPVTSHPSSDNISSDQQSTTTGEASGELRKNNNSHEPARASLLHSTAGEASGELRRTTEKKIAAIGIRVRQWVTYHGIAINVNPDLSHYNGIVPCGISEFGVTSLADMGKDVSMAQLDAALKAHIPDF